MMENNHANRKGIHLSRAGKAEHHDPFIKSFNFNLQNKTASDPYHHQTIQHNARHKFMANQELTHQYQFKTKQTLQLHPTHTNPTHSSPIHSSPIQSNPINNSVNGWKYNSMATHITTPKETPFAIENKRQLQFQKVETYHDQSFAQKRPETERVFIKKTNQFENRQELAQKEPFNFINLSSNDTIAQNSNRQPVLSQNQKSFNEKNNNQERNSFNQSLLKEKIDTLNKILSQKYILEGQLREQISKLQKSHLQKQFQVKELNEKITYLQSRIKLDESNKASTIKQKQNLNLLLRARQQRIDELKGKMDKQMYFSEDLIHSKDFQRLEESVQFWKEQNRTLIQQHEKYIQETKQIKVEFYQSLKNMHNNIQQLIQTHHSIKNKIETLQNIGEDKLITIKLQNQINFLKKKCEEQLQKLIQKENELSNAVGQIKSMTELQNLKSEHNIRTYDEINLHTIKDSLESYQIRIKQLTDIGGTNQQQINQQKKTIDFLNIQLRKTREDRHINTLKDKNIQNHLKNQLTDLQRTLRDQVELSHKKIKALEEINQRKSKEITEKNKFIQDYLINRNKNIDKKELEPIIEQITILLTR